MPIQMVIMRKTKEAQLGYACLNPSSWEVEAEEPGVFRSSLGFIVSSKPAYTI